MSGPLLQHWLARTSLLSQDAGAAVVGVPDQVSAEQLAKRFDPLVLSNYGRKGVLRHF